MDQRTQRWLGSIAAEPRVPRGRSGLHDEALEAILDQLRVALSGSTTVTGGPSLA